MKTAVALSSFIISSIIVAHLTFNAIKKTNVKKQNNILQVNHAKPVASLINKCDQRVREAAKEQALYIRSTNEEQYHLVELNNYSKKVFLFFNVKEEARQAFKKRLVICEIEKEKVIKADIHRSKP